MLRNIWYPAIWGTDLAPGSTVARRIAGQSILFARFPDGDITALTNRCSHKLVPLDMGKVCDGAIECPYHGLKFDRNGRCVANPHPPHACPSSLNIRAWPVAEVGGMIWLWPGDPALADTASIPRFPCLDPQSFRIGTGTISSIGHYQLLSDNILDLSHIAFLHPNLGTQAVTQAQVNVRQDGERVTTIRTMSSELLPEGLAAAYGVVGVPVDRTMTVAWQPPGAMLLTVELAPAGLPEQKRLLSHTVHLVSPKNERECHYFYAGCRPKESCSEGDMERFQQALDAAFNTEDKPIIEAQQLAMEEAARDGDTFTLLGIDEAGTRARRIMERLIAVEQK